MLVTNWLLIQFLYKNKNLYLYKILERRNEFDDFMLIKYLIIFFIMIIIFKIYVKKYPPMSINIQDSSSVIKNLLLKEKTITW